MQSTAIRLPMLPRLLGGPFGRQSTVTRTMPSAEHVIASSGLCARGPVVSRHTLDMPNLPELPVTQRTAFYSTEMLELGLERSAKKR